MQKVLRVVAILLLMASHAALASQEGTLPFSAFRLESPDLPPLGRVVVSGDQGPAGVTRLEARAFGKTFLLGPKQLEKLHGFSFNGAQLSQISPGRGSGGGQIYLVLFNSFLSGAPERRYVVFRADGKIGVGSRP